MSEPATSLQVGLGLLVLMLYYFITIYRINRIEDKIDKVLEEISKPPKEEEQK